MSKQFREHSYTTTWGRRIRLLLLVALLVQALPFGWVSPAAAGKPAPNPTPTTSTGGTTPTPTPTSGTGSTSPAPTPSPTPTSSSTTSTESRVHPQLMREAGQRPNQRFRVIVTRLNNNTNADREVTKLGGTKIKDLPNQPTFVAELPGSAIAALGRHSAVKYVAPDAVMLRTGFVDSSRLATDYTSVMGATQLWSPTDGTAPITGLGVGIAILDTGVTNRPDFRLNSTTTRLVQAPLFNSDVRGKEDGHGHGTHVAGIAAGNSWWAGSGSTIQGRYIGVAPEAKIINVRVSNDQGMSYVSDVVSAIDWVIANRTTHNIRVMNLSLISSVAESYKTSALSAAVERAWFNGIFVVVAAGNLGPNTAYYPPANDPFVVTVGAADTMGTLDRADDTIAFWSTYGTTQDGFTKPDVVAPGRHMVSPLSSSTATLATLYPDRIVDGTYIRMSGTSMAAPAVAGLAALAFQAHPDWNNDQVKWLLTQTTTPLGDPAAPLAGQGVGEVDAYSVVRYSGVPSFANQNLTINEQLVTKDGSTTYSSASWSTASWSTASWSTASWSTASWSTASWSTSNFSTASWSNASEPPID